MRFTLLPLALLLTGCGGCISPEIPNDRPLTQEEIVAWNNCPSKDFALTPSARGLEEGPPPAQEEPDDADKGNFEVCDTQKCYNARLPDRSKDGCVDFFSAEEDAWMTLCGTFTIRQRQRFHQIN